jgi:hypothetical protein
LDVYPWSGHRILVGKGQNDWQERKYVLQKFHRAERKAIQAYRGFMEDGMGQGRRPELVGGGLVRSMGGWSQVLSLRGGSGVMQSDARILGGGDFVADILKEVDRKSTRFIPAKSREDVIGVVIQKICREEGIGEKEICLGGRARKVSEVRAMIASHLRGEYGISMAEIARHVGVCTSAVANSLRKKEKENNK